MLFRHWMQHLSNTTKDPVPCAPCCSIINFISCEKVCIFSLQATVSWFWEHWTHEFRKQRTHSVHSSTPSTSFPRTFLQNAWEWLLNFHVLYCDRCPESMVSGPACQVFRTASILSESISFWATCSSLCRDCTWFALHYDCIGECIDRSDIAIFQMISIWVAQEWLSFTVNGFLNLCCLSQFQIQTGHTSEQHFCKRQNMKCEIRHRVS